MGRIVLMIGLLAFMAVKAFGIELTGEVRLPDGKPAKEAVVYLEGDRKAEPLPNAMVDQMKKTFIPHVSVVTRGTTVRFPNNDTVFHNVFAYYQAKRFDLGMYPRGATKKVTFDKPGLVALFCNVHTEMNAYIMVVDTPYYAVTDAHGRFHIDHLPAGTYTLHGWHETGATTTQSMAVEQSPKPVTVDLVRK